MTWMIPALLRGGAMSMQWKKTKSARERAARHGRGECRCDCADWARLRCRRLVGRRRCGPPAHQLLGLGPAARPHRLLLGHGFAVGSSAGARPALPRCWRAACSCPSILDVCFDFGSSGGGAAGAIAPGAASAFCCWSVCCAPLYSSFGTPCSRPARRRGRPACDRRAASSWCRGNRADRSDRNWTRSHSNSRPERRRRRRARQLRSGVADGAWSISCRQTRSFSSSALGDRRKQSLQRFSARTQTGRRLPVERNHVEPLPRGRESLARQADKASTPAPHGGRSPPGPVNGSRRSTMF